ncbi:MAG: hypothetical protein VX871_03030, partial [Pseudomonadota bacterium]|nr:hypothetical protein [Pseudomonadota bacterium]
MRTVTGLLAFAAVTAAAPLPVRAYDASWYKTDFWAGEYPRGFTLDRNLRIAIRARDDPGASRNIDCALPKGATFHPWNDRRVKSSRLAFVSYVPKATYLVTK